MYFNPKKEEEMKKGVGVMFIVIAIIIIGIGWGCKRLKETDVMRNETIGNSILSVSYGSYYKKWIEYMCAHIAFYNQVLEAEKLTYGFFTEDTTKEVENLVVVRNDTQEIISAYDQYGRLIEVVYTLSEGNTKTKGYGKAEAKYAGTSQFVIMETIQVDSIKDSVSLTIEAFCPGDNSKYLTVKARAGYEIDSTGLVYVEVLLPYYNKIFSDTLSCIDTYASIVEEIANFKEKAQLIPISIAAGNNPFIEKLSELYLAEVEKAEGGDGREWACYISVSLVDIFGAALAPETGHLPSLVAGAINIKILESME